MTKQEAFLALILWAKGNRETIGNAMEIVNISKNLTYCCNSPKVFAVKLYGIHSIITIKMRSTAMHAQGK